MKLLIITLTLFYSVSATTIVLNEGEDTESCCPLKWIDLSDENGRKTALTDEFKKHYYARSKKTGWFKLLEVDESEKFNLYEAVGNPNGCKLSWNETLREVSNYHRPKFNGMILSRVKSCLIGFTPYREYETISCWFSTYQCIKPGTRGGSVSSFSYPEFYDPLNSYNSIISKNQFEQDYSGSFTEVSTKSQYECSFGDPPPLKFFSHGTILRSFLHVVC